MSTLKQQGTKVFVWDFLGKLALQGVQKQEGIMLSRFEIWLDWEVYAGFESTDAKVSKAKTVVGYVPTHDIYAGMEEAIEWYVERMGAK